MKWVDHCDKIAAQLTARITEVLMENREAEAEVKTKARVEGRIAYAISRELGVPRPHVESVVRLLDEGNTIPFLARYRKEQTGGLDEEVLRAIEQRLEYLRNLADRRAEVIRLIDEQGVLTPEIMEALEAAATLQRVEDIYRPFRPKRRTRASVARERGLEPLADWLMSHRRRAIRCSGPASSWISTAGWTQETGPWQGATSWRRLLPMTRRCARSCASGLSETGR